MNQETFVELVARSRASFDSDPSGQLDLRSVYDDLDIGRIHPEAIVGSDLDGATVAVAYLFRVNDGQMWQLRMAADPSTERPLAHFRPGLLQQLAKRCQELGLSILTSVIVDEPELERDLSEVGFELVQRSLSIHVHATRTVEPSSDWSDAPVDSLPESVRDAMSRARRGDRIVHRRHETGGTLEIKARRRLQLMPIDKREGVVRVVDGEVDAVDAMREGLRVLSEWEVPGAHVLGTLASALLEGASDDLAVVPLEGETRIWLFEP